MKNSLQSELQTLLEVETAMLKTWLSDQEGNAESLANNINVRMMSLEILGEGQALLPTPNVPSATESRSPQKDDPENGVDSRFAKLLAPSLSAHDYTGFILANRKGKIMAASESELVDRDDIAPYKDWLAKVVDGSPTVSRPFPSVAPILDDKGRRRTEVPTMFVAAPVRDNNFQVVAVLALRTRPEKEFTRILQLGQIGDSGETYAFDEAGVMISNLSLIHI